MQSISLLLIASVANAVELLLPCHSNFHCHFSFSYFSTVTLTAGYCLIPLIVHRLFITDCSTVIGVVIVIVIVIVEALSDFVIYEQIAYLIWASHELVSLSALVTLSRIH